MTDAPDSPLLQNLNPPQREAVTRIDGPLLVIAGAGSGKTRVITHRIAWLIAEQGIEPWRIFAATFTNKAAREMKNRVGALCDIADASRLSIGTFHAHCARILRREAEHIGLSPRYTVCDDTDQTALLRDCINALGMDPKEITPRSVSEAISLAKMALLEGPEAFEYIRQSRDERQARAYELYQKRLADSDAVDFDDLLLKVVRLFQTNDSVLESYRTRYQHLLVDEYQDTNLAQFELVRLLAGPEGRLCVVGDEDQSIYSWRGADIRNLLEFEQHFPGARLVRLEQNYRSSARILAGAEAVIQKNTQRLGKHLWTEAEPGDPILTHEALSERDEARRIAGEIDRLMLEGTPLEEIAMFYRVNALSRVYEEALRERGIPYRVIGGLRFFDRAEIKDLLAYLAVVANPGNLLALLRILNTPRRGIGKAAESKLLDYADRERLSLFEVLRDPEHVKQAGLKGRAAKGAGQLALLVESWMQLATEGRLRKLVETILHDTGYEESLGDPKSIEVLSRIENIGEFVGSVKEYEKENPEAELYDYLESVALRAEEPEDTGGRGEVSLMTVHNAKGLEFDVVFIVALERHVFPNRRALQEQMHAEEERRLFYVALTRARRRIYLTHATRRSLYGQTEYPAPSVFLWELPEEHRLDWDQAELAPLPRRESAPATAPTPPAKAAAPQRWHHEILGEITIIEEVGSGRDRRYIVHDRHGNEHVLLAAQAALQPLRPGPQSPSPADDEMPF